MFTRALKTGADHSMQYQLEMSSNQQWKGTCDGHSLI